MRYKDFVKGVKLELTKDLQSGKLVYKDKEYIMSGNWTKNTIKQILKMHLGVFYNQVIAR
jgi:hypothetical protein